LIFLACDAREAGDDFGGMPALIMRQVASLDPLLISDDEQVALLICLLDLS
jgi:hypothetical protein